MERHIVEEFLNAAKDQSAMLHNSLKNVAVSAEQPDTAALGGMAITARRIQRLVEAVMTALGPEGRDENGALRGTAHLLDTAIHLEPEAAASLVP